MVVWTHLCTGHGNALSPLLTGNKGKDSVFLIQRILLDAELVTLGEKKPVKPLVRESISYWVWSLAYSDILTTSDLYPHFEAIYLWCFISIYFWLLQIIDQLTLAIPLRLLRQFLVICSAFETICFIWQKLLNNRLIIWLYFTYLFQGHTPK